MNHKTSFFGTLPVVGSDVAAHWDQLYIFLVVLSVFFFVLVVGGMLYFAAKYRASKGGKSRYITGSHFLEGIFIAIPTLLLAVIFAWGYFVYHEMTQTPANAMEVRAVGKQWLWQFQYDTGKVTVGELFVPANRPIKLVMTSEDVIHSLFIPAFRVKQDVVPGMYTSVWFEARTPGEHTLYCTEYCGTSHSGMLAKVHVLSEDDYQGWLEGKKLASNDSIGSNQAVPEKAPVSMIQQGKNLFASKGCVSCHTPDGHSSIGPTPRGLFGSHVELADGTKVVADEAYLRESIEKPQAKIVKGFAPQMPTFKGLLTETEMNSVIAYLKSL